MEKARLTVAQMKDALAFFGFIKNMAKCWKNANVVGCGWFVQG